MLRTETDVKYIGDEAVIVPLDVPVSSTYEHLLSMIYSRTGIDKKQFQLVLNCRYPLKRENRFQPCPIWDDNSLSQMLKLVNTFGMDEIELYIEQVPIQPRYDCGPSSALVAMTYECRADEDEEECESQEGDDQSERAEDIQQDGDGVFEVIDEENNNVNVVSSFLALHEAMEGEQGRYVSMDGEGCDMSNNLDPEDPIEFSPVQYHSAPSLQFENVENIATKVLVLRCKKAKQSQCPWKLCAMVVKDRHPGIMAAMSDVHLGWSEPYAYHKLLCVRREQCANRLASNEEYTPYVDAKIKANVVKAGSHEIVLYDHIRGQFHVKTNKDMEYRGHSSDLDPLDTSVLVLQDRHKSHLVDSGQDVAVILGLRIHGLPITGTCDIDWSLLCYELLGVTPPIFEIRGSAISTRWLCHQFSQPPLDLDDATLERYARAFILGLIGSALFTYKKVLAHLYRELCRASLDGATDNAGCVTLLQTPRGSPNFGRPPAPPTSQHLEHDVADDLPAEQWRVPLSWAQNPSRVLTFYRDQLDAQTHDQTRRFGERCHLLICFDIVEWHRPELVLRQFGLQQGIPPSCSIELDLHSVDRRGQHKYDWGAFHAQYITLWGSREERIATTPLWWVLCSFMIHMWSGTDVLHDV
ncbi:Serine/threonine-protein phosphatase 7 long form-like [Vitis vinifera]|uniref:Serine/threonine-protein phosphatase 7 long form-like n=1 Tax=Vitis vinifera TaxID=29760 RepID=A0A438DHB7_VITVI|nr:Serine/threonine-protein phosphatase 7 long form-like [Vitis vinifera]